MSEQNANPVELFGMRVAHVGINATDPADALEIAELFSTMMGLPVIETPVSYFNDSLVEIMKQNGRGTTSALPLTTSMQLRSGLPSAGSRSTKSRARCCPTVVPSSCTLSASSPVSPCTCAASSAQAAIAGKKG